MLPNFFKLSSKHWSARFLLTVIAFFTTISVGTLASVAQNQQNTRIIATFLPIYMFTRGVTGDDAQVDILIPPGAEVHDYQATPGNVRELARADILVKNGLGMEEFLEQLIANAGNPQLKQIDSSQGIEPIEDDHDDDHGHGHEHEEGNPHVWLDPVLAQQQVANIRDGLIEADPANAETYRTNAAAYIEQLQQLDEEFTQRLAPVRGCKFIAFHDAFPYLARRYGLEQMAIVELPEDSITPSDIQRVAEAVEQYQVKALLSEPQVDDKRLQQIANDLNLPVEQLDPIESGEADPQYYFQAMEQNLQSLERACQ
ncbi:zinc ABC transporter substrate-binding protein [Pleurocapsales cyanobacterium LEGE 06147]|nr:zinc ABC transporter substrate-binding protein [Pleurocapsales cyanobacterium LEGE 06147]